MGSRIREKPERVFELFTEIARPTDASAEPFVLQKYPADYNDVETLNSIPKFAFPCGTDRTMVEHFTFVLTDIEGKFKFGFCRQGTMAQQTCLLIISHYPWYEIFYSLLNLTAEILNRSENSNVELILEQIYNLEVPDQYGAPVEVVTPNLKDKFAFNVPGPQELLSIPESRNLTEYYNAVDSNNMMIIFASMLYERRILITSRKLSRLTSCVHGSAALLYPMHWQHLYIPVLPVHLIDYCSAPMPFLIGVHSNMMELVRKQDLGDAVILDADANTVTTEYDDLSTLPKDVRRQLASELEEVMCLKKGLKAQQADRLKSSFMGDGVARTFLRALVSLIGNYREALRFQVGQQITFDREAFIQSRPPHIQPFLEKMLQLQIFEQFINDRLELLNSGQGFTDEFEREASTLTDKSGAQTKYKEWASQMKKQGKRLKSQGKEKWSEFTGRANPAMRHAVQTVKNKSKKAYNDLKSKMDTGKAEDETAIKRSRRSAAHRTVSKPMRPPPPDLNARLSGGAHTSVMRRSSYDRAMRSEILMGPANRAISHYNMRTSVQKPIKRRTPEGVLTEGNRHSMIMEEERVEAPKSPTNIASQQPSRAYKVLEVGDLNVEDSVSPRSTRRLTSADDNDIINDLTYQRISVGLLEDPDIQKLYKRSFSMEDMTHLREDEVEQGYEALEDDQYGALFQIEDETESSTSASLSSSDSDVPSSSTVPTSVPQVPYHPVPAPRVSKIPQRAATAPIIANNANVEPKMAPTSAKPVLPSNETNTQKNFDLFNMPALDFSQDISKSTPNIPDKANNNLPAEQSKNVSISRQNAFYNMERPPSVKRRSLQPGLSAAQAMNQQAVKEARTAFIQSEVTKPDLSSGSIMDIFDPLTMGSDSSLSSIGSGKNVSGGLKSGAHVDNGDSQDDLLKEWNLDTHFTKMKIDKASTLPAQHPPLPLQLPTSTMRSTIMGGAGFGGNLTSAAPTPAPRYGMGGQQQYPGVPAPYPSSTVKSLISNSAYNRNSMPPLSSNSPIHAQIAALQQRSQSPLHAGQVGPPMLRPLSATQRASSPEKTSRDSRGTSPAIAQTIASLSAAAEYHGNTKPKSRLAPGSVKKVITNIEQTQTNLDLINELSFLQNSSDGANSQRNTPSPSLQNNQTSRSQWETFD